MRRTREAALKEVTVGFLLAAAAAFVAGFVLTSLASLFVLIPSLVVLFQVPRLGVAVLLVPSIALVIWLSAGPAVAEDSWRGATKRMAFLVMATAAAFITGIFLVALVTGTLIVGYEVNDGGSLLLLLLIPLLLVLFAGAAAASVWLARRSRISQPWFPWFLTGAGASGPALLALFVLAISQAGE